MRKRMTKLVFGSTILATWLVPAIALAEEAAAETAGSDAWQVPAFKAIAAGAAMGLSALGAGYAQAKIGSAGAGTLAERPEVSIWVITLQALPEVIVLLGFVSSIMLVG
jgi:V/A-type H+-transporting ATPase subunit K